MWKRSIQGMLAAVVLSMALMPGLSSADNIPNRNVQIKVDGKSIPIRSLVQNNRILVPADLFLQLGAQVDWNEHYQSVVLSKDHWQISLPSGKQYADFTFAKGSWKRESLSTMTTDQQEGTFIPLRYAAEKLGIGVSYLPTGDTVEINTRLSETQTQNEQLKWLYKITEAEAGGESYEGRVAVAASILNRVKSPNWPKTPNAVIFQVVKTNGINYYQYSPVQDGRIYQVTPSEETVKAVNAAVHGDDPTHGATTFYNPEKTDNQWVRSKPIMAKIGNHVFAG